jgi:hypothetical protein
MSEGLHWKDGYEEASMTQGKTCLIELLRGFPFFQLAVMGYSHILMLGLMLSAFTSITSCTDVSVTLNDSVLGSLFVDLSGGLIETLAWDRGHDEGKLTSWLF